MSSVQSNPFYNNIVTEPRQIETALRGLNDVALTRVLETFSLLESGRAGSIPHSLFITSPQPGFGKSHLIGRIFQKLEGRATLIYIPPFEDPDTCWKSLLERVVDELSLPQRDKGTDETTQLEHVAKGVLTHLVSDRLAHQFSDMQLEVTKSRIDSFFSQPKYVEQLANHLHRRGFRPNATALTLLNLLYAYLNAVEQDDYMLRLACLDWLHGDRIDEEEAQRIGILNRDNTRMDASSREVNELSKKRLLDILMLGSFYRPFVLCFDQTETYGKYPDLSRSLAIVIQTLVDYGENSLTLLTANIDPWINTITPHWEDSHKDRIEKPFIELEGLLQSQAIELIYNRLNRADVETERIEAFIGYQGFVDKAFSANVMIGIRKFLELCQHQWQAFTEQPPLSKPDVEAVYDEYRDKFSKQQRPFQFDRDVLNWFVTDLASNSTHFIVEKIRNEQQDPMTLWRHGKKRVLFGFEAGSHWKRWNSIARHAVAYCEEHPGSNVVYMRTPEQRIIPGENWKVKPDIEKAMQNGLTIRALGGDDLVTFNAARHLYQDALQGDSAFSEKEVVAFLTRRFETGWLALFTQLKQQNRATCEAIMKAVEEKRVMSLDVLNATLNTAYTPEEIAGQIQKECRRIRIHASAQETILQWLPGTSA